MTREKTLGQIAFEADSIHTEWQMTWAEANRGTRATYERIAKAVAREVMRRMKKGKK